MIFDFILSLIAQAFIGIRSAMDNIPFEALWPFAYSVDRVVIGSFAFEPVQAMFGLVDAQALSVGFLVLVACFLVALVVRVGFAIATAFLPGSVVNP